MTKDQFSEIFKIAQDKTIECPSNNAHIFNGFGLHNFKPVVCSAFDLAELMRYQAKQLNGQWDMDAIQEIYDVKHKFLVIGMTPGINMENPIEFVPKKKETINAY